MAVVSEGILHEGGGLCFGDYSVEAKLKVDGFEHRGDIYRVKTHKHITRLEKNSRFLIETVPGAAIHNFSINEKDVSFFAEGYGDTQITLGLEPDAEYKLFIGGFDIGRMKTNISGKVSFSIELGDVKQEIKISRI